MANDLTQFVYDPSRQGYDETIWDSQAGTPTISSGKLRFNAAAAVHLGDITKGEVSFLLTVPTVPTSGDVRFFGLKNTGSGLYVGFKISGDDFLANIGYSGTYEEYPLTWSDSYTNTESKFTLIWEAGQVKFQVNGVTLYTMSEPATGGAQISIPNGPLSAYISNENSDDMDLTSLTVKTRGYNLERLPAA